MEDLREKFFKELEEFLAQNKISALTKIDHPSNGSVIKLNGIALYKVLKTPNPFKQLGVAIYRNLTDGMVAKLGGKRAKGKNGWVAAPLTDQNYNDMFDVLSNVALQNNIHRNKQMQKVHKQIQIEKRVKAKKKRASRPIKEGSYGI